MSSHINRRFTTVIIPDCKPLILHYDDPEISMLEAANKMARLGGELFGYAGKVVRKVSHEDDYLVDNPNRRCPIIEKARAHLGYDPKILVDEGMRRSLIWYFFNREAEEA